jgi:hypothetical protein
MAARSSIDEHEQDCSTIAEKELPLIALSVAAFGRDLAA